VKPGCFLPQDDETVKCWGLNDHGQLGLGDTINRGDDANGPCPPSSTTASCLPAARVLALAPALRAQRWGVGRTTILSTWGLGGRPDTAVAACSHYLLPRRDGRPPSCRGVLRLLGRGYHQRGTSGGGHIDEQLRVRRWLHGGCGGERGRMRGVHGGDVHECHGLRGVYGLPEQCGIR